MRRGEKPKLLLPPCRGCDHCGIMYGPFEEGPDGLSRNHDGQERLFIWTGKVYLCRGCYRG